MYIIFTCIIYIILFTVWATWKTMCVCVCAHAHMCIHGTSPVTKWKRICLQCRRCRRHGSIPWSGRSPGEGNGTHSCILAWKILWAEEPGSLQAIGFQRVRDDWSNWVCMCIYIYIYREREREREEREFVCLVFFFPMRHSLENLSCLENLVYWHLKWLLLGK